MNIRRDIRRRGQRGFQFRRHSAVPGEPGIGARAVSGSFQFQQLFGKGGERRGHAGIVHGVAAVRMR